MKKKQYKVKYENGQIKPLEPLDMENNQEGIVIFEDQKPELYKKSLGKSLAKHAGAWVGDDLDECLKEVYNARGKAEF